MITILVAILDMIPTEVTLAEKYIMPLAGIKPYHPCKFDRFFPI